MEIYDKSSKGFIEVWLTKEEKQRYDRELITKWLLRIIENKKCKVVFFLSGNEPLYTNIEGLLLKNT